MKLHLRKNNYRGKLIVFEGTDGAGKTTLIELSAKYLNTCFDTENIVLTKQPTDLSRNTKLFQKMMYCKSHDEIDYRAVQLLTMSDRIQHTKEIIEPALKEGKIVVCDRYIYTSLANMLARKYKKEKWFYEAARFLIKPDYTFFANIAPYKAIERIKARPEESNRHLDQEQLRKTYHEFISMSKKEDFIVVNTDTDASTAFMKVESALGGHIKK